MGMNRQVGVLVQHHPTLTESDRNLVAHKFLFGSQEPENSGDWTLPDDDVWKLLGAKRDDRLGQYGGPLSFIIGPLVDHPEQSLECDATSFRELLRDPKSGSILHHITRDDAQMKKVIDTEVSVNTSTVKMGDANEELSSWLSQSDTDVVYFSIGSMLRKHPRARRTAEAVLRSLLHSLRHPGDGMKKWRLVASMPAEWCTNRNMKNVFRAILDYEDGQGGMLTDTRIVSDSLYCQSWVPQKELLRHPHVKLFISHCGLNSVHESLSAGVPVLPIPFFNDQFYNAEALVRLGMSATTFRTGIDIFDIEDGKWMSDFTPLKSSFMEKFLSAVNLYLHEDSELQRIAKEEQSLVLAQDGMSQLMNIAKVLMCDDDAE